MKRGDKRTKTQRESDRATIAKLSLKGWNQLAIAAYLELSQAHISRELKLVRGEWKESTLHDHDLEKGRILDKLRLLQEELWGAWEQSKSKQETSLVERVEVAAGTRTRQQKRFEGGEGNSAYLRGVLDCVREEAKVLNLYPSSDKTANSTAEQRNSGGGLSEDTVEAIKNRILGITDDRIQAPSPTGLTPVPTEVD